MAKKIMWTIIKISLKHKTTMKKTTCRGSLAKTCQKLLPNPPATWCDWDVKQQVKAFCSNWAIPMAPVTFKTLPFLKISAKSGNLNIKWEKDGKEIERSMGKVKKSKWAIVLEDLVPKDTGNYTCIVCNSYGCISHNTRLLVKGKKIASKFIKRSQIILINIKKFKPIKITQIVIHQSP